MLLCYLLKAIPWLYSSYNISKARPARVSQIEPNSRFESNPNIVPTANTKCNDNGMGDGFHYDMVYWSRVFGLTHEMHCSSVSFWNNEKNTCTCFRICLQHCFVFFTIASRQMLSFKLFTLPIWSLGPTPSLRGSQDMPDILFYMMYKIIQHILHYVDLNCGSGAEKLAVVVF